MDELEFQRKAQKLKYLGDPCRFNDDIFCVEQNCLFCGWNPEVFKERLAAIRQKYNVKQTRTKTLVSEGFYFQPDKLDYTPTPIKATVEKDSESARFYLEDTSRNVRLVVPLELVKELLHGEG